MNDMFTNIILRPPRNNYQPDTGSSVEGNYDGLETVTSRFAIKNSKSEVL
jgi:hypothetical protein